MNTPIGLSQLGLYCHPNTRVTLLVSCFSWLACLSSEGSLVAPIFDKDSPYHTFYSLVEGLILNSTFPEVLTGFWSWSEICENNFFFL